MNFPDEELSSQLPVTTADGSRILAIDWGERRVGLAISDPLGISAQGLPNMSRRNKEKDENFLRSLVRKRNVSLIVLGNPLQMDGTVGRQAEKISGIAEWLRDCLGIPVELWDERLTSMEANRFLDDAGINPSRRNESVDRLSATLLLQNYLDARSNRTARAAMEDEL